MTEKNYANETLATLTDIYNELTDKPIKKFSCSKAEAIKRIEKLENSIEPKAVEPEPKAVEPEPKAVEPEPKAEVVIPEVVEPVVVEPVVVRPEPLHTDISIKLKDPNTMTFPELVVLTDLKVSGEDEAGNQRSITPDSSLRFAGHMVNDKFLAVRSIKTDRYRETSHDFIFNTVSEHLQNRGIEFGVWKTRFNAPHDHMTVDMILNKKYQINETLFESDLGVQYNTADKQRAGIYQPMIRLTNSFFSASRIEFALIRILCANGMYKIADKLAINFNHLDKNILQLVDDTTDEFMGNIFEERWIESFISQTSQLRPKSAEAFLDWLIENAGKRGADRAITKFNLTSLDIQAKLNMWMVYNIVTWLATHQISNLRREQTLFQKMKEIPTA